MVCYGVPHAVVCIVCIGTAAPEQGCGYLVINFMESLAPHVPLSGLIVGNSDCLRLSVVPEVPVVIVQCLAPT